MSLFGFTINLQTTTEKELTNYIELLAKYETKLIFTSLIGFENKQQELWTKLNILKELTSKNQMMVYAEINKEFLENHNLLYKKSKELINFFINKGLSGIKCDDAIDLRMQSKLTYNKQEFKIIINGSHNLINLDKMILKYHINAKNVVSFYNAYRQRYTAASVDNYLINQYESHVNDIAFAGFVGESEGCSLEIHRDWNLIVQVHHLIALGTDIIIVADQLISEEQVKLIVNSEQRKVTLAVELVTNITDQEKTILFADKAHFVRTDLAQDLIISFDGEVTSQQPTIAVQKNSPEFFEIGDVVICNDKARSDAGQLQIVSKRIKNDGIRNLVAKVKEPYRSYFLSELKATRSFKFVA